VTKPDFNFSRFAYHDVAGGENGMKTIHTEFILKRTFALGRKPPFEKEMRRASIQSQAQWKN